MSCIQNFNIMWNDPTEKPITKYFTPHDLWLSFEKWSAYGAKTKVIVNREVVDQFFVPSLSAIQIFTNKPYESVENLSKSNPGLQTLTSIDLTPSSWMCVAWYPICQIPNIGIPIKDFEAAFLTFHTISSFYQDFHQEGMSSSGVQSSPSISLPPFGCATYKVQGDIWFNHGHSDYGSLSHLNKAAESWIRQLDFEHHDFNFFTRQTGHHLVGAKPSAKPSAELYFPCVPNFSGFWP
ncbi:hypothetical protein DCAR_0416112 [Daucus carota subsp. sativus]|uniref:Uncharacterized protein n=1 Tax=Daucus carota subsp. sativus TaxID=79200 RepID=A0AAF0WXI2_DAUCS|nr:hypothetical protein DCAR_0416112 [Daucus carota subsp. sativus]